MKKNKGPKILILDIETSPIHAYVWGLYDQNIAVNQIKKDWKIISWAAKWLGERDVYQQDISQFSEKKILLMLRGLMDMADIIVGQNSKQFDIKKINARFIQNKIKPPSSYQQIDTKLLAKKHFAFTSNGLEYMSHKLNKKYKKLKHKDFPGMELWTECMKGNKKAWTAMAEYNIFDVLATEELYKKLAPYGVGINLGVYYDDTDGVCSCGSRTFRKNGYFYSAAGKFQRYYCAKCSAELKHKKNLFKGKMRKI